MRPVRAEPSAPPGSGPFLLVLAGGFIVLGGVTGFGLAMDRQIQGGILAQHAEAIQRPDWSAIEALPAYVPEAFLLVVDPTFVEGGLLRSRGNASTLPREMVRQIHLLGEGIPSAARELVMAPLLEHRISRDDLLEFYLNRVYLGRADDYPVYGIHHAALEYFKKDPAELSLGEAATLAGLLLEPRLEDPRNRAGAVGIRRNEVLKAMLNAGQITSGEFAAATTEWLGFQPGLSELPMSRRILTAADTAVIRLPQLPPEPPPGPG